MSELAQTRRRTGVPARFTQADLVRVGVAIVDAQGFDAVTLRAVAGRLGVSPMALYTYVKSKDELVDLILAQIVRDQASQAELPDAWDAALRALAHGLRGLVLAHPQVMQAYHRGLMFVPEARAVVQSVLGVLVAQGFSLDEAVDAYNCVHMFALGFAATEQSSRDAFLELEEYQQPGGQAAVEAKLSGQFDGCLATILSGIRAGRGDLA